MKNPKEVYRELRQSLIIADSDEKEAIARTLMEVIFNFSYTDILSEKPVDDSAPAFQTLKKATSRLNEGEPLQYVLGQAHFCGLTLLVDPSVLIPRPETEELVSVVISHMYGHRTFSLLDIGTGSGCIPVAIASKFPHAKVFAVDISPEALDVARKNAEIIGVKVNFSLHDILKESLPYSDLDVIVSNPPYIGRSERDQMDRTVLDHEPDLALFVPDNDVLIFYRRICELSAATLKIGGLLAFEINEKYGQEVKNLMIEKGFSDVSIVEDISGKERIVKGLKGK